MIDISVLESRVSKYKGKCKCCLYKFLVSNYDKVLAFLACSLLLVTYIILTYIYIYIIYTYILKHNILSIYIYYISMFFFLAWIRSIQTQTSGFSTLFGGRMFVQAVLLEECVLYILYPLLYSLPTLIKSDLKSVF